LVTQLQHLKKNEENKNENAPKAIYSVCWEIHFGNPIKMSVRAQEKIDQIWLKSYGLKPKRTVKKRAIIVSVCIVAIVLLVYILKRMYDEYKKEQRLKESKEKHMNARIKRQNSEDKENELKLLAIQLQGSKSEFEKKCDEREKALLWHAENLARLQTQFEKENNERKNRHATDDDVKDNKIKILQESLTKYSNQAIAMGNQMRVMAIHISKLDQNTLLERHANDKRKKIKRKFEWSMYDGEGLLIKKFNSYEELKNDEAGFADYLKKSNAWEQANKVEYEERQEEFERQQDREEQRAEREEDQRDQRKQARSEKQKSYNNDFGNVDNNDRKEQRQIHDKPRSRTSDKRKSNKAKEEVKIPIEEQMKTRERELENKGTLTQNEVLELEYIQDELANWMEKKPSDSTSF